MSFNLYLTCLCLIINYHLISLRSSSIPNKDDLVVATVLARPSLQNKSPYVGDVQLEDGGRTAIAHMPSLDMGGKCVPGAKILLKPAREDGCSMRVL